MDENPEEKKCPQCGRPNLAQAKKCWYCQAPFTEPEETQPDTPLITEDELWPEGEEEASLKQTSSKEDQKEQEETAPEWLRRIRTLIAAEKKEEEPANDWQQQQLFTDAEKKAKKPAKPPRASSANALQNEKQVRTRAKSSPETQDDTQPSKISPELPDGFTPLPPHSAD